ncbi:hypothetical protein TAMA11512_23980 [Selenomonas sp. TAMA-11512]|uniref:hypothetical protein n=1 Tax=Selenomonas sp. TAMA-11512 TaxID=3095337 RepID=UPI0030930F61|nr:hypothetical protein TAMA11512_23980 [Selenomonas sp. TAMA-11512]
MERNGLPMIFHNEKEIPPAVYDERNLSCVKPLRPVKQKFAYDVFPENAVARQTEAVNGDIA